MIRFVARRLIGLVLMLLVISGITFLVFFLVPASPALQACGKGCTPQQVAAIEHKLGLDRPRLEQYVAFTKGIVVGRDLGDPPDVDSCPAPCFGYSFKDDQPVWELIQDRFPVTFSIAVGAAVLWLTAGVLVGVGSALRRGTWFDKAAMGVALAAASVPVYLVGIVLLYLLAARWQVLPYPSYVAFTANPLEWAKNLILPWTSLAFVYAALYARLTRASMLETLQEDYIRTARAKGLSERQVIAKHGVRPALIPILTIFGLDLGTLLGGAILTERVFNFPGLGTLALLAIGNTDLPVIMGVTLVTGLFIALANLVVDVLYAVVDPRVRYS